MVKLFTFSPGRLILSSEVNANFTRITAILGEKSTASEFVPPGQISLGQRQAASLSALTDKIAATNAYLHLGWNARESYDSKGNVVLNRVSGVSDGATALRIGSKGFSVLGTLNKSSDLNKAENMRTQFAVESNTRIYVNPALSFVTSMEEADDLTLEDYRLTFVPLETPYLLEAGTGKINDKGSGAEDWSFNKRYDLRSIALGVPNYHGVEVHIEVQREAGSGGNPVVQCFGATLNPITGTIVRVNDVGWTAAKGPAFFKRGANANTTLHVRTRRQLNNLKVYITGVWK